MAARIFFFRKILTTISFSRRDRGALVRRKGTGVARAEGAGPASYTYARAPWHARHVYAATRQHRCGAPGRPRALSCTEPFSCAMPLENLIVVVVQCHYPPRVHCARLDPLLSCGRGDDWTRGGAREATASSRAEARPAARLRRAATVHATWVHVRWRC